MPSLKQIGEGVIQADQEHLGRYYLHVNSSPTPVHPEQAGEEVAFTDDVVIPELIFTENDTNLERLYGVPNVSPYVKDAFHDHIIPSHRPVVPVAEKSVVEKVEKVDSAGEGDVEAEEYESDDTSTGAQTPTPTPSRQFVNSEKRGTKAGAHYVFKNVPANGGCAVVRLKLTTRTAEEDPAVQDEESFDSVVEERRMDSDEFYSRFNSGALSDDMRNIMRQALSGMLWCVFVPFFGGVKRELMSARRTKQFYMFIQKEWIEGDPGQPPPPPERKWIRNMVRLFAELVLEHPR